MHGVCFSRMSSPLGCNAQFCCERSNSSLCYFSRFSSKVIISKVMASQQDDRKSIAETRA